MEIPVLHTRVASGKDRAGRSWSNPGFTQGEDHPVVCVNWDDARAYVNWMSRKTGKNYRLLSEAEWEYAVRGGTQTRYSWGNGVGRNRANCDGCGSRWDDEMTAPVGSFSANEFGLYDMHGNVFEWTQDCWNDSYTGAPKDGRAWETADCRYRVVRGGSCSTIRGTSVRRTAAGSPSETGSATADFALPGLWIKS